MDGELIPDIGSEAPLLWTTKQVVQKTSWSKATIQRLVAEGALTPVRPPGHPRALRLLPDEVFALLSSAIEEGRANATVARTDVETATAPTPSTRRPQARPNPTATTTNMQRSGSTWRDFLKTSA